MQKQKFSHVEYIARANILLHAYLLRVPIPECLHEDLKIVLKDAHRLLTTMFDVALSRKMLKPAWGAIELMQLLSQAMWAGDSSLRQLPHLTDQDIKNASKKRINTLEQFRVMEQDAKEKLLKGITKEQWEKINLVCDKFPTVKGDVKYCVEDEEDIYEGDLILVTVTLDRIKSLHKSALELDQEEKKKAADDAEEPEAEAEEEETALVDGEPELTEDEAALEAENQRELELLETLPVARRRPKANKFRKSLEIFSPFFPFPKRERWFLMLMQRDAKNKNLKRPLAIQKILNFMDTEVIELRMPAGAKGTSFYEIHAMCDSYVGIDITVEFKINVKKMTPAVHNERIKEIEAGKENGLDEVNDFSIEEEEDYIGYWYFLGYNSFFELVLNVVVMCLLALFVYNFLHTRGYWQKYVDPIVARVTTLTKPFVDKVYPVIEPVLTPLMAVLTVAWNWFSELIVVDEEATAEAIRRAKGEL